MDFETKVLSREISQMLWERQQTLSTAESCTGGRISEAIIATPGSSAYFKGGIVCYVDEIKERLLGVSHETLEEHTAVSEEVARQMVAGACRTLGTDFAIAATGVAGPGGGTREHPVGTIWLACGDGERFSTLQLTEDNGRDLNLLAATRKALEMLSDFLKGSEQEG